MMALRCSAITGTGDLIQYFVNVVPDPGLEPELQRKKKFLNPLKRPKSIHKGQKVFIKAKH